MNTGFVRLAVATVPTVYGIETYYSFLLHYYYLAVATVPTVYGIETLKYNLKNVFFFGLQQYLPFTVLKLEYSDPMFEERVLQQYLPFTVLKLTKILLYIRTFISTALQQYLPFTVLKLP